MALETRTFRVFVSSTFADLKEERNALQERVFPRLQAFCLEHGARFQAIDLRWGVSAEAARDQQTINICLDEVRRCQRISPRPNFIVLLGDRYGWQPPPPQIPASHFDEVLPRVLEEGDKALLEAWYLLDENARSPERYLKPREEEYRDDAVWGPVEARLRSVLEAAVAGMPLEVADRRMYETSATEQEIQHGALTSLEDHVFCYFRTIDFGADADRPAGHDDPLAEFLNVDASGRRDDVATARLARLKDELRRLPAENVHDYPARWTGRLPVPITTDHVEQFCVDVHDDLLRVIAQELDRLEEIDAVDKEIEAHSGFGQDRARFFVGRAGILDELAAYLENPGARPFVVYGAGGSGKSSVIARGAQQATERFGGAVVVRFIGATADSSNGRALLEGLCREITRKLGGDESSIPADFRDLGREFTARLGLASEDLPLVVFIDALDQLSAADGARSLSWLPTVLPPGVRVVVSVLEGDMLDPLLSRVPESNRAHVTSMTRPEAEQLLDSWLADVDRTLQPHQRDAVLRQFAVEGRPLWLKFAFEEARRWKSSRTDAELPPTIAGIIEEVLFPRLEDDANHGRVLVAHSLGSLAAAKNGLTEDEILDVLSLGGSEAQVLNDFRDRSPRSPMVERLPVIVWSRLFLDLEPYLTERLADETRLLGFYHRQLAEAVADRYLTGADGPVSHRELAAYFGAQDIELGADGERAPNRRKMSELPYQQAMGELWDELLATLTDFDFLERKATHAGVSTTIDSAGNPTNVYSGVYQICDDFALALEHLRANPVASERGNHWPAASSRGRHGLR